MRSDDKPMGEKADTYVEAYGQGYRDGAKYGASLGAQSERALILKMAEEICLGNSLSRTGDDKHDWIWDQAQLSLIRTLKSKLEGRLTPPCTGCRPPDNTGKD